MPKKQISQHDQAIREHYNSVPYESYPFNFTHPQHLKTIGRVFGIETPDIQKCRVLELGCAAGGNMIPWAVRYPESQFVGVDLSDMQVEEGQKTIQALGLKNIHLHNMSIADIEKDFGQFDYIICHGVFSWVPESVQAKILEVSKAYLSPEGVAFISYNVLPGWNVMRSLREMLNYHTSGFEDNLKLGQAKALLQFVSESITNSENPYHKFIKPEIDTLMGHRDAYIAHEYLEGNNKQFYFHEFMQIAESQGLQYLGDTALSSMYLGNMPPKVAEVLQTSTDLRRTEQYMDFINNRRFRQTVLCHANVKLKRNLDASLIEQFHTRSLLRPQNTDMDVNKGTTFEFTGPCNVTVTDKRTAAILLALSENTLPLSADEIIKAAAKKLNEPNPDSLRAFLHEAGMRFVFAGAFEISVAPPVLPAKVSNKPKAFSLARYEADHKGWATTQMHLAVNLDAISQYLIRYADGKTSVEEICKKIVHHIESGDLKIQEGENLIMEPAEIAEKTRLFVEQQYEHYRKIGLLEA